jgi:glutamine amidotransferase
VLAGRCFRLAGPVKVPHVGWNTLTIGASSRLLRGLSPGSSAYFSHTYAAPRTAHCVSTTTHGVPFASSVEFGNVFGVQFHPEKSGRLGLAVLASFLAIARGD